MFSILVHTFNQYHFAWPGFFKAWREHMNDYPVYWGSDFPGKGIPDGFIPIFSGPGEWSDRLINLLRQIPADTVLYMQEDHWPKKGIYLDFFYQIFKAKQLKRLQVSPVTHFYTLYGEEVPLFFYEKAKSKYLIAHNPSFWDKSFLLSVLESGQSPWQHEYEATCKLWQSPESIRRKIAIYPCDWYHHAVIHGQIAS